MLLQRINLCQQMARQGRAAPDSIAQHADLDLPANCFGGGLDEGGHLLRLDDIPLARRCWDDHAVGGADANNGGSVPEAGGVGDHHGVPVSKLRHQFG
jgi:hypothetical protein